MSSNVQPIPYLRPAPTGFVNIGFRPIIEVLFRPARRWKDVLLRCYRCPDEWLTHKEAREKLPGFYPDGFILTGFLHEYAIPDSHEDRYTLLDGEVQGDYVLNRVCRNILTNQMPSQSFTTEIPIYEL